MLCMRMHVSVTCILQQRLVRNAVQATWGGAPLALLSPHRERVGAEAYRVADGCTVVQCRAQELEEETREIDEDPFELAVAGRRVRSDCTDLGTCSCSRQYKL